MNNKLNIKDPIEKRLKFRSIEYIELKQSVSSFEEASDQLRKLLNRIAKYNSKEYALFTEVKDDKISFEIYEVDTENEEEYKERMEVLKKSEDNYEMLKNSFKEFVERREFERLKNKFEGKNGKTEI